MMIFGIDPGFTGAIAALDQGGKLLDVTDMPTIKGHGKVKAEIDELAILHFIESCIAFSADGQAHVFIEKVSAMPGQGVTSMFRFGVSYGIVRAIAASLGLPVTLISPQAWQGAVSLGTAAKADRKALARRRAAQLFPRDAPRFHQVKDGGRADAVLIAYAGQKQLA